MKKTFFILLALFLFGQVAVQAQQQVLPPLVNVNGVGEVRVQPDQVILAMGVEVREKTLEQARKQADAKAAAIISYLKKQGVSEKDIQTSYMSIYPIYTSGEYGKASPDFYTAQKTMTVIVRKLNKFDDLMSGLYGAGVNRVDGVQFQVADIEKYKAEARKKAVNNAKQKATALTTELGAKVGRVYAINESTNGGRPIPLYAEAAMMKTQDSAGAEGPTIAGGEVIVTSNVSVSFIIEN
ncbi:SIMPL domain-containing protein [Pontibacter sp. KCTC 32443]|uniref:SIMPL domain-containing protein n=1 Tax=Pontibacter TaxID=323449 RepID=UPI00164D8E27|nr:MULTISPECIES: SIMPL domain-containing protein [Pontibacter]MBC5773661.1 SIMPL domain-containing protein [Pontibacter sp. KCTC 32443]